MASDLRSLRVLRRAGEARGAGLLLLLSLGVLSGGGGGDVRPTSPWSWSWSASASAFSLVPPSAFAPRLTASSPAAVFVTRSSCDVNPPPSSTSARRLRKRGAEAARLVRRAGDGDGNEDGGCVSGDRGGANRSLSTKRRRRRRRLRTALAAASALLSVWRSDLLLLPSLPCGGNRGLGMEAARFSPLAAAATTKVIRTERITGGRPPRSPPPRTSPRSNEPKRRMRDSQRSRTKNGSGGSAAVGVGVGGGPSPSPALGAFGEKASRIAASARAGASRLDPPSVAAGAGGGLAVGILLGRAGGGSDVLLFRASSSREDEEGGLSRRDEERNGPTKASAQLNATLLPGDERTEEERYWERRVAALVSAAEETERRARDDERRDDAGTGGRYSSRWTAKGWTALSTSAPGEERVEAIMASYAAAELRDGRDRDGAERRKLEDEARATEDAKVADRARVEALIGATARALSSDRSSLDSEGPADGNERMAFDVGGDNNVQAVRMARRATDDLRRKFEAARTKTETLEAELTGRDEAERALRQELDMWRRMKKRA